MLGAFDEFQADQRWQVSIGWRYQKSDRHFRGIHEEPDRQLEGSEVVNTIHLPDLSIRYNFNPQTSLSVSLPFLMAERSLPIRDENRDIIGRTVMQARGLSDVTVTGRRLLFDPAERPRGNVSLGFGLKLPTGDNNVLDVRERFVDGEIVNSVETVDQSIQPGDGGFGFLIDASGYRELGSTGEFAGYFSGVYLFNPEESNGVKTFRSRETEAIMSVADQYLFRVGVQAAPRSWKGWGVGLGGRIEGVPVHDLIGGSEDFRRPGYAISAEPSLTWARGPHSVTVALPIAVQRNRQRSVPDMAEPGRIGDAAFADWVLLLRYFRSF